jgi:hypothetical protein
VNNSDIFQLSPDFHNAVVNLHNTLMPVAFVVCVWGLVWTAVRANHERALSSIWPELTRILCVALFLCNMGTIGDWFGSVVASVEQESGINANPMQVFSNAIYQKFGVDLSKAIGPITPGGLTGPPAASTTPTISNYGYEQPGDPNYDSNSALGIGAFDFSSHPGSLIPGQSLAISPSLSAGLTPGQQVTVNLSNGQSITGIYADKTADSWNGQTLYRVDIYDPNHQYDGLSGSPITSINGQTPQGNNLGDWFNSLLHPAETAQVALFGLFTLALCYVAAAVMWLMSLLQSILYYCAIALGPIFVGFLLVRGLENIAKAFLLGFFAICLWPVAFLVSGLITILLISLGTNSSNTPAGAAANTAGLGYLWMIVVGLWVIASSVIGPWIVSKRFSAGATGMADMVVGSARGMQTVGQTASSTFASSTRFASSSFARSTPFSSYARRPRL